MRVKGKVSESPWLLERPPAYAGLSPDHAALLRFFVSSPSQNRPLNAGGSVKTQAKKRGNIYGPKGRQHGTLRCDVCSRSEGDIQRHYMKLGEPVPLFVSHEHAMSPVICPLCVGTCYYCTRKCAADAVACALCRAEYLPSSAEQLERQRQERARLRLTEQKAQATQSAKKHTPTHRRRLIPEIHDDYKPKRSESVLSGRRFTSMPLTFSW